MNEIIVNVYNDEVNVGVEEIIETVTIVITENAGVPSDAPIETISKNGTQLPITAKNVDITVPTKTSELEKDDVYTKSETYTQTEINNKLSAVYKYKGSVLTYDLLPIDAENADVWNVTNGTTPELNGMNYAWNSTLSEWDELGGIIGLATLTENGLLSKEDFAKLQNLSGTNTGDETQSSIGALVEATELTAIADDTKIAASNGGVLNWFSGLRIKEYLTGFFAKLSGGNTFSGTQNVDGMINHKAGEYFYTAASKTADTVNDTRVINSAGVEIHSICTVPNAAKGGGTWVETYRVTNGKITINGGIQTTGGYLMSYGSGSFPNGDYLISSLDTYGILSHTKKIYLRTAGVDRFLIDENGNMSFFVGKFQYNAASPTSDTINDRRTSVVAGVKIEEICTGVSGTKGGGTWAKTNISGATKTLTNNTLANILDINVASQTMQIVRINYSIVAKDATTVRSHAGTIICNVRNQNGVVSSNVLHVVTLESDLGNIADTWALVDGSGKTTLNLITNASGMIFISMLIYMNIESQGSNNTILL